MVRAASRRGEGPRAGRRFAAGWWSLFVGAAAIAGAVGMLAGERTARALDPGWQRRVRLAARCRQQLLLIAAAQDVWRANRRAIRGAAPSPTWEDLVVPRGMLADLPRCPAGGLYTLHGPAGGPACSLGASGTRHPADDHAIHPE